MSKVAGGCLCGNIRYSSDAEPMLIVNCHCTNCQKQGGAAFSVNLVFPKGSVTFEGDLSAYHDTGDSGQAVIRHFCANCGSPILSRAAVLPDVDIIKAGTLDDPSWVKPQMNLYCDSAQPWVAIDQSLQNFDKMMPAEG